MTHTTEQERAQALAEKHGTTSYRNRADTKNPAFGFTLEQLAALIADVEQAARRAPVVQKGDYLDGVHIPRLREALTFLGRGNGFGEGDVASKLPEYVNSITRAVLACKELLRSVAPAAPVWYVPVTASMGTLQWAREDGWNACVDAMLAAAPEPPETETIVQSMAMLLRQLTSILRSKDPESSAVKRAMDFMTKQGLNGSPLRADVPENSSTGAASTSFGTLCASDEPKSVPETNNSATAPEVTIAAAPQPPDAFQTYVEAPVELPEPGAWLFIDRTWTEIKAMGLDHGGKPAYTEKQVRQLLAAAKEAPC